MLRLRILTALVLVPSFLVVILLLPAVVAVAVFAAMVLVGAWEWSAFVRERGADTPRPAVRIAYVIFIAALMAFGWRLTGDGPGLALVLGLAVVWWTVAFLWIGFAPARVSRGAAVVAGGCVLVPAWIALARLQLTESRGPQWVVYLLVLISLADVGAYFAGRRFGRLKLAPQVSPGKTWEGLLGGLCFAAVVAVAGSLLFALPTLPFFALGVSLVLASVVGDLTESLFKRFAGLKDSGTIFPGHGGVLDRIDSVTAAAPLFLLGLTWLGAAA